MFVPRNMWADRRKSSTDSGGKRGSFLVGESSRRDGSRRSSFLAEEEDEEERKRAKLQSTLAIIQKRRCLSFFYTDVAGNYADGFYWFSLYIYKGY